MANLLSSNTSSLIQSLQRPDFYSSGIEVDILRLDQLHPVISGNKWLKLQYWLQQADTHKRMGIITKGGPWSNHVHATAFAAKLLGLSFTAIIKAAANTYTTTLQDVDNWGGTINFTQADLYDDEAHWQQLANTRNLQYIPMGGDGPEGREGVTEYFNTITTSYDFILCPIGTGTTFEGIAHSSVPYKHLIAFNPGINDKHYELLLNKLSLQYPDRKFLIKQDAVLRRFGKYPTALPAQMNNWYTNWQLPTDIVYTAKMLWQFESMLADDFFPKNSRILLVHTGGLQGNRSLPKGLLNF